MTRCRSIRLRPFIHLLHPLNSNETSIFRHFHPSNVVIQIKFFEFSFHRLFYPAGLSSSILWKQYFSRRLVLSSRRMKWLKTRTTSYWRLKDRFYVIRSLSVRRLYLKCLFFYTNIRKSSNCLQKNLINIINYIWNKILSMNFQFWFSQKIILFPRLISTRLEFAYFFAKHSATSFYIKRSL